MRKWSCTPADVDGDKNVAGRYAASAPLFFIQQSGIGNASPLLKDAGSRATHKEEMPDRPAWKLSIRLNYRLGMNEVKKKGKKKKDRRNRGTERKRERKKVAYTYTGVRCVISEMANENGERRLWSRNGIACPTSRKIITLWISAWLAKKEKKKKRDDTNYRDDRWRMISGWATPVPEYVGG